MLNLPKALDQVGVTQYLAALWNLRNIDMLIDKPFFDGLDLSKSRVLTRVQTCLAIAQSQDRFDRLDVVRACGQPNKPLAKTLHKLFHRLPEVYAFKSGEGIIYKVHEPALKELEERVKAQLILNQFQELAVRDKNKSESRSEPAPTIPNPGLKRPLMHEVPRFSIKGSPTPSKNI